MRFVDLKRRFLDAAAEADALLQMADCRRGWSYRRPIDWDTLLQGRCVVVLGEEGSGKSAEFRARADLLLGCGKAAFYLPFDWLVQERFEDWLGRRERIRFDGWLASQQEGWFFLDGMDYARAVGRDPIPALNKLLRHLGSGLERARLFISCRASYWRGADDRGEITAAIWGSAAAAESARPNGAGGPARAPRHGQAWVVQLAPLEWDQVEALARHLDQPRGLADPFLKAVAQDGAHHLARRPRDVEWLLEYWTTHHRLGSYSQLIRYNIEEKLRDRGRGQRNQIPPAKALEGASVLAGMATLLGKTCFVPPSETMTADRARSSIDAQRFLKGWTGAEIETLLALPIFAEAIDGCVRFHHRVVQDFLTALLLHGLPEDRVDREDVRSLLFPPSPSGLSVSRPLAPVAAWLALLDREVLDAAIRAAPEVLIQEGDARALAVEDRGQILLSLAGRPAEKPWLVRQFDSASLRRFATVDLADTILDLLGKGSTLRFRATLLRMIDEGAITACAEAAFRIAADEAQDSGIRQVAAHAAALSATHDLASRIVGHLVAGADWLDQGIAGAFTDVLVGRGLLPNPSLAPDPQGGEVPAGPEQDEEARRQHQAQIVELRLSIESIRRGEELLRFPCLWTRAARYHPHRISDVPVASAEEYGEDLAAAVRQGTKIFWRMTTPPLPHEDPAAEDSRSHAVVAGLHGLAAEVADNPGFDFGQLSAELADRAARYAAAEVYEFPDWFDRLYLCHPEVVAAVLRESLLASYEAGHWDAPVLDDALAKLPRATPMIRQAAAAILQDLLVEGEPTRPGVLASVLECLLCTPGIDLRHLAELAQARCCAPRDEGYDPARVFAAWWVAWLGCSPSAAAEFLGSSAFAGTAGVAEAAEEAFSLLGHRIYHRSPSIWRLRDDASALQQLLDLLASMEASAEASGRIRLPAFLAGLNARCVLADLQRWLAAIGEEPTPTLEGAARRIVDVFEQRAVLAPRAAGHREGTGAPGAIGAGNQRQASEASEEASMLPGESEPAAPANQGQRIGNEEEPQPSLVIWREAQTWGFSVEGVGVTGLRLCKGFYIAEHLFVKVEPRTNVDVRQLKELMTDPDQLQSRSSSYTCEDGMEQRPSVGSNRKGEPNHINDLKASWKNLFFRLQEEQGKPKPNRGAIRTMEREIRGHEEEIRRSGGTIPCMTQRRRLGMKQDSQTRLAVKAVRKNLRDLEEALARVPGMPKKPLVVFLEHLTRVHVGGVVFYDPPEGTPRWSTHS